MTSSANDPPPTTDRAPHSAPAADQRDTAPVAVVEPPLALEFRAGCVDWAVGVLERALAEADNDLLLDPELADAGQLGPAYFDACFVARNQAPALLRTLARTLNQRLRVDPRVAARERDSDRAAVVSDRFETEYGARLRETTGLLQRRVRDHGLPLAPDAIAPATPLTAFAEALDRCGVPPETAAPLLRLYQNALLHHYTELLDWATGLLSERGGERPAAAGALSDDERKALLALRATAQSRDGRVLPADRKLAAELLEHFRQATPSAEAAAIRQRMAAVTRWMAGIRDEAAARGVGPGLVERLWFVCVKLALCDDSLIMDHRHPVRMAVDELALRVSLSVVDGDAARRDAQRIARDLQVQYDRGPDFVRQAIARLQPLGTAPIERFERQCARAARARAQRTADRAAAYVQKQLASRAPAQTEAHALASFLDEIWAPLMHRAVLRHGADADCVALQLAVADALLVAQRVPASRAQLLEPLRQAMSRQIDTFAEQAAQAHRRLDALIDAWREAPRGEAPSAPSDFGELVARLRQTGA